MEQPAAGAAESASEDEGSPAAPTAPAVAAAAAPGGPAPVPQHAAVKQALQVGDVAATLVVTTNPATGKRHYKFECTRMHAASEKLRHILVSHPQGHTGTGQGGSRRHPEHLLERSLLLDKVKAVRTAVEQAG